MNDDHIIKIALAQLQAEFGSQLLGVAAGGSRMRAAYLVGAQLPQIINNHYRIAGRWLAKPKRVLLDLESWDPRAAELARSATVGTLSERVAALEALIEHTLAPLGGPMPLAWSSEWEELEA